MSRVFVLVVGLLILVPNAFASLSARVDRETVSENESLNLTIEYTGNEDTEPSFVALERNFEVLGNQRSQMTTIVNGRLSARRSWQLELMPRQAGVVTIPSFTIGADSSEPIQVVVRAVEPPDDTRGEDVVLEVSVDTETPYVQAQVIYTVTLLVAVDTRNASLSDPQLRGVEAIVQKLGEDQRSLLRRDGREYSVVERKYALFPQASGELTIAPLTFEARLRSGRRFSGTRRIRSESLNVDVQPVPASFRRDYPGAAWLPARSVRLESVWPDPMPRLVAGVPLTRRIDIIAEGLTAAQLPELTMPETNGVKQYPDNAMTDDRIRTGTGFVVGMRRENVALIPTYGGRVELPGIELPWWNTREDRVEVARLPPAILTVAGDLPVATDVVPDVAAQAPTMGQPVSTSQAGSGIWPWLALALGAGWLVTLIVSAREIIRRAPAESVTSGRVKKPSLRELRRAAAAACRSGDAGAARDALLAWGQRRYPGAGSLGAIAHRAGDPLAHELQRLDRHLYGRNARAWNGDALARALTSLTTDAPDRILSESTLPPLYPRRSET